MPTNVHPVDEHLPMGRLTALGLQHVLVMYAGAVAVPLISGGTGRVKATLLTAACGLPTVLGAWLGFWLGDIGPRGPKTLYTARFRTVGGVKAGDPVVLRGVKVGRVEAVRLAVARLVGAVPGQVALLASFLPAMMLSGFLFDLRNVPRVVYVIGQLLPATHFMEVLRTLFLAGNIGPLVLKNGLLLLGYVLLLLAITRRITRKSLD